MFYIVKNNVCKESELTPKSQTKIQKKIYAKRLRGLLVAFVMQLPV